MEGGEQTPPSYKMKVEGQKKQDPDQSLVERELITKRFLQEVFLHHCNNKTVNFNVSS